MDTRTRMHASTASKAKSGKRNEGRDHKQTFIVYLTDFKLYKLESNNLNNTAFFTRTCTQTGSS